MQVVRWTVAFLVVAAPVVLWPEALARAAALWPLAGDTAWPWPAGHGVTVLAVPLVALSAATLFLAPGLLLALLTRRATSAATWVLTATPIALGVAAIVVAARPGRVGISTAAISLLLIAVTGGLASLVAARAALPWPLPDRRAARPLVAAGAVILLATLGLGPKLLWESFNGDGAHAFEASRLLLTRPWPFFPAMAGDVAGFPGPTSMLFIWPNAWFLGVFGTVDAAVRLPFVIYLPLLVLALQSLAEERGRPLGGRTQVALWLGMIPLVLAMAYSASYEPYQADLALPGVQDLLLLVVVVGFFHAMVRREFGWALVFALLSQFSLPNGLVLMGFWLIAEIFVTRPVPTRALLAGGGAVVLSVVAAALLPALVTAMGHPAPGGEYGLARAIGDVLRIDPFHWRRMAWWLVGGAIFPVITLAWWRRQDDVARRLTVVACAYFLFFHVQARVALHHFVPAMILPLVVAARLRPAEGDARRRHLRWWLLGTAVATVLAAPRSPHIATVTRTVGMSVARQVGDYRDSDPAVFRAASLLSELFPPSWAATVPAEAYGGSPLAWMRYASDTISPRTAYLLVPTGGGTTPGGEVVAETADARLLVLDRATLAAHRALRPRTDTRAPVFAVPRTTLFGPGGPRTVDLLDRLRGVFR